MIIQLMTTNSILFFLLFPFHPFSRDNPKMKEHTSTSIKRQSISISKASFIWTQKNKRKA